MFHEHWRIKEKIKKQDCQDELKAKIRKQDSQLRIPTRVPKKTTSDQSPLIQHNI
jgi:hypothetical protein